MFINKDGIIERVKRYKRSDVIMENIYRVLFTRSRKNKVIFIPNDRFSDETCKFFKQISVLDLD